MKKILIGLLALGSVSAFSSDVCVITSDSNSIIINANCTNKVLNDAEITIQLRTKAKSIKELIDRGYSLTTSSSKDSGTEYIFIRD